MVPPWHLRQARSLRGTSADALAAAAAASRRFSRASSVHRSSKAGGGGGGGASGRLRGDSELTVVGRVDEARLARVGTADERAAVRMLQAQARLERATRKLEAHDADMTGLLQQTHKCAGTVFVSFGDVRGAQRCLRYGGRQSASAFGRRLEMSPAPPAEQVHWENLALPKWELLVRQLGSTLILLLVSLLCASIIASATYLKPDFDRLLAGHCDPAFPPPSPPPWPHGPPLPYHPPPPPPLPLPPLWPPSPPLASPRSGVTIEQREDAISRCLTERQLEATCELSLFESLAGTVASTALIIGGYIAIFIVCPILANVLERAPYDYQRELSVFLKLTFFQARGDGF